MPEIEEIARLAIQVLDAQQRYFRSRTREDLIASKTLEGELRKMAFDIINPPLALDPGDRTGAFRND